MVEKLQELGYPIDFDRVREIAGGDTIARPHVAQAMVEAGIVPNEKAAFTEEFIADGGRAWVPKHALHPLDALTLIAAGRAACACWRIPGMWKGARLGARRADRGDGRGRHGRTRGRPSGSRRGPARDVPGDGRRGSAWCRRARPIATATATTRSAWGARPPTPSASPSSPRAGRSRGSSGERRCPTSVGPMVFFDIGGVMYDDTVYARAIAHRAPCAGRDASPTRSSTRCTATARAAQSGSFRGAAGATVPRSRRRHRRVGGGGVEALGVPAGRAVRRRPSVPGGARRPVPARHHREPTERGEGRDPPRRAGRATSRCGGSPTTSGSRSPIRALFTHVLREAGVDAGAERDGRRSAGLRRASGEGGRDATRCGCSAERRPTIRRRSSSRRPTRRSTISPSCPSALEALEVAR